MPNYMEMKRIMRKEIQAVVNEAGKVDLTKLIAERCLKTGFTEKTVAKVLSQMEELGYIKIEDNIVYAPATYRAEKVDE